MGKFETVYSIGAFKVMAVLVIAMLLCRPACFSQHTCVGAYYFDGWTGKYPYHITTLLKDSFAEREPRWGWITSSQNVMDQQIVLAADAGLSFFNFCWYYRPNGGTRQEPLNNALSFYLSSRQKSRLKFCITVTNEGGCQIGNAEWPEAMDEILSIIRDKQYYTVDGKPLIVFFSGSNLINKFGSAAAVKSAFDQLRTRAKSIGLKGVSIALVSAQDPPPSQAAMCGFDLLTGYNYHSAGFKNTDKTRSIPIEKMQEAEPRIWSVLAKESALPIIPAITLNWDPRPWASAQNNFGSGPYYTGFSALSVYRSVTGGMKWLNANRAHVTKEGVIFLYAWNENGEGAYLTPSKNGDNFLEGVKRALKGSRYDNKIKTNKRK